MFQNHCISAGEIALLKTATPDEMYKSPLRGQPVNWSLEFVDLFTLGNTIPHVAILNDGLVDLFWPSEITHAQFDMVCSREGLPTMARLFQYLNAHSEKLLPLYELCTALIPYPDLHPQAARNFVDKIHHTFEYKTEHFMPVWRIRFRKPVTNDNYQALAAHFRQAFEAVKVAE